MKDQKSERSGIPRGHNVYEFVSQQKACKENTFRKERLVLMTPATTSILLLQQCEPCCTSVINLRAVDHVHVHWSFWYWAAQKE